jgi:hypothetical protein
MIREGIDLSSLHAIRCAINNWTCSAEIPIQAEDFVREQKHILNPPESGIDYNWIQKNSSTIVKYFWKILKFLEKNEDSKKFSIAPIQRIRRHFLTIDSRILYYMMREANLIDSKVTLKNFSDNKEEYFGIVFKLHKIRKLSKGQFTYLIQTDAVSLNVHFRRPKASSNASHEPQNFSRKIAIDPGRSNIIFGVERLDDEQLKLFLLEFSTGKKRQKNGNAKFKMKSLYIVASVQEQAILITLISFCKSTYRYISASEYSVSKKR